MNHLDLDSLDIFRTVVAEGSVTGAAAKLNRVQSNVSTRIRQLEERLGVRLFERHNRSLKLSPQGQQLLGYAEQLLNLSAQAEAALSDGTPRGLFRIGTMECTAAARLPPLLASFHQTYPDVEIQLIANTTADLLASLQAHELDAAFVAAPVNLPGISSCVAYHEELVLITPLSEGKIASQKPLNGRSFFAFRQGCAYRRYLESWLRQHNIIPRSVIEVGSYHTIVACVASGAGAALVPESVLAVMPPELAIQRTSLPQKDAQIDTVLTWRGNYDSASLFALKKQLENLYS